MNNLKSLLVIYFLFFWCDVNWAQSFAKGVDLSYVNEMEDCGATFKQDGIDKDVYDIFGDNGANYVRLRLWHTPDWYDDLNGGKRYSDYDDVKKSIIRAKNKGLQVLLDFHLSDTWADPSKQLVPKAWENVVDNTMLLSDSLYQYVYNVLDDLGNNNLLPDMVQIGNETNKGILLSASDNNTWTLQWDRNSLLFNKAIQAVRDVSISHGKYIDIMLHIAGPADTEYYINEFTNNGVTDFDVIGVSYYWQWHQPKTIEDVGLLISKLKVKYPSKKIMVAEAGYPYTFQFEDTANNILTTADPDYGISVAAQYAWLRDLTSTILENGGDGIFYWEPAWVSTSCNTLWGKGSHYENATFFDFDHNVIENGGFKWLNDPISGVDNLDSQPTFRISSLEDSLVVFLEKDFGDHITYTIRRTDARLIRRMDVLPLDRYIDISSLNPGSYILSIESEGMVRSKAFVKH